MHAYALESVGWRRNAPETGQNGLNSIAPTVLGHSSEKPEIRPIAVTHIGKPPIGYVEKLVNETCLVKEAGNVTRRMIFKGWADAIPPRMPKEDLASDYDILRAVILAEESAHNWTVFQCEDRMHAIKVANRIKALGFVVDVVARGECIYIGRAGQL